MKTHLIAGLAALTLLGACASAAAAPAARLAPPAGPLAAAAGGEGADRACRRGDAYRRRSSCRLALLLLPGVGVGELVEQSAEHVVRLLGQVEAVLVQPIALRTTGLDDHPALGDGPQTAAAAEDRGLPRAVVAWGVTTVVKNPTRQKTFS